MILFDTRVRYLFLTLSCFAALQGIYMHSLSRHQQQQMQPHSTPVLQHQPQQQQQQQQQQSPKGAGVPPPSRGSPTPPLLESQRSVSRSPTGSTRDLFAPSSPKSPASPSSSTFHQAGPCFTTVCNLVLLSWMPPWGLDR